MENNNVNLPEQSDYYLRGGSKLLDFILGYIGLFVLVFLFGTIMTTISSAFYTSGGYIWSGLIIPLNILFVAAIFFWANIKLKKKRRYITKGVNFALLTIVLIPVLFFGACLIAFSGRN